MTSGMSMSPRNWQVMNIKTVIFSCWLLAGLLLLPQISFAQTRTKRTNARARATPRKENTTQPPAPPMPVLPDIRHDPDVEAADVALIANITIRELRFDRVPNPTVEFLGKRNTSTIWHADRYNLPDKVEPGVTYRNVGIRLKITSRLADIDRIVSEALGEIPITEDVEKNKTDSAIEIKPKTPVNPPAATKETPHE
jgi:hypothetical protein